MSIITARSISKRYRLGTLNAATLREEIQSLWDRWRRGNAAPAPDAPRDDDFWALRDVSFDIQEGDVVGIIGGNGAGKSTLLKVLSRITEPTYGEARIRGRVASLLEVGTGFHPELSGRENIFLNGTILGMSKGEVKAKFDEIVDFSGIEKFIDTPVKRYSSGMYVRLAFAVAAHLDPEIMIVDEVLAVGDGEFQKKCLGKMKSIHESGRTVLFVSHQLNMLTSLCTRGIVLKQGTVSFDGPVDEAVLHYRRHAGQRGEATMDFEQAGMRVGDSAAVLHRVRLETVEGRACNTFELQESIVMRIEYSLFLPAQRCAVPSFFVFDGMGDMLFVSVAVAADFGEAINRPGRYIASSTIPGGLLNTGTFTLGVQLVWMNPDVHKPFFEQNVMTFQVSERLDEKAERTRSGYMGEYPGTIRPVLPWEIRSVDPAAHKPA